VGIVEGENTLLAVEKTLRPAPERSSAQFAISVVFTSVDVTLRALEKAGSLARSLGARITLFVPQIVPFPLPLATPPVLVDWNEKRFDVIAGLSPVETAVRIYLCRDRLETLRAVLPPASIVVIGCRKHWWPAPENRLAAALRRAGHHVILSELE
jgi:hypothetical protein